MTDIKPSTRLQKCFHCHEKDNMEIIGEVRNYRFGDQDDPTEEENLWQILRCPNCFKDVVIRRFWYSEWDEPIEDEHHQVIGVTHNFDEEVIYPKNVPLQNEFHYLPVSVNRAYEIALRVYPVDLTAFAIFLRKTIECLCKDKGANNGQLAQKINDIANRKIIPENYKTVADLLREYGNDSAHECNIPDITQEEADRIYFLSKKILEYVYEIPGLTKEADTLKKARTSNS